MSASAFLAGDGAGDGHRFDVAIAGGGVFGLATGIRLLQKGRRVGLCDPDPDASTTRAAAGMLSSFAEMPEDPETREIVHEAYRTYGDFLQELSALTQLPVEHAFNGTLILDEAGSGASTLAERAAVLRERGVRCHLLSEGELLEAEPALRHAPKSRRQAGLLLEREGYVDPRALHTSMRRAFEVLGGVWIEEAVTELMGSDSKQAGLRTTQRMIRAEAVAVCVGPSAQAFLADADRRRLKPRGVRGEILRVRPGDPASLPRHVVHAPGPLYLVPRADGSMLVGATSVTGHRPRTTAGGVLDLLSTLHGLLPNCRSWDFVDCWSGVRPWANEGRPAIVEDSRGGIFHGIGLYRSGILVGPYLGRSLADRIDRFLGSTVALEGLTHAQEEESSRS